MLFKTRKVSYQDFVGDVKTGDIVLMEGTLTSSRIIEYFEGCPWSHSAMLVWEQDIPNVFKEPPESNRLLLWESNVTSEETTPPPVLDLISGKQKSGPQLVELQKRISHNYTLKDDSSFAIRHLYLDRDPDIYSRLEQVIQETHSATFPTPSSQEFKNFIMGRIEGKQATDGSFFCSQLLSYTFMKLGVISSLYPDNSYAPGDFSEKIDISLLKRGWFGKEITLDTKTIPYAS